MTRIDDLIEQPLGGTINPQALGGDRFKHPEIENFIQIGGVAFEVHDCIWIKPLPPIYDNHGNITDEPVTLKKVVERKIKSIIEAFKINNETILDDVVLGDDKPSGKSIAIIDFRNTVTTVKGRMRGPGPVSGNGYVTFAYKEDAFEEDELFNARDRTDYAASLFFNYLRYNPDL